ncbi:MAG TPA: SAM-dependent chlorinase/fluorinase [Solirubrobacteraceae bacterium]|nr:SAM-dependent chlorinase/fluorinase [Solirubrobacteraceae bacterium]
MAPPLITLLTDYGLQDDFVGICHGVIASICPDARVIDITHGVARHDVQGGALALRAALRFMPVGVHVAVVDPDVGAERRAVALGLADGRILVGPDNGVLSPAAQEAGGINEAVDIARSPWRLEPVSATFHGRDIFAPVAGHLAAGGTLDQAGEPLDPDEMITLELPRPVREPDALIAHAIAIDRFGNVQLDAGYEDLIDIGLGMGATVALAAGDREWRPSHYVRTFADVVPGELLLYEDADRSLAVAVNHGSAAELLGLAVGDELRIGAA